MNQHTSPVLYALIVGLLLLVTMGGAVANPAFIPVLTAVDADKQEVYLLDAQEFSFNKQVFQRYRLWRNSTQTGEHKLISWLGTKLWPLPQKLVGMSWDGAYQRLLFVDAHARSIFALDPTTNKRALVSGANRGSGAALEGPGELVVDPVAQRIIVIDAPKEPTLVQIALDTGDRAPFFAVPGSIAGHKGGYHLALDINSYQAFLSYGQGVLAIDMHTGEGRRLSDGMESVGQGPVMIRGEQIAFDYNRNQLVTTEPLLKRVLGIDVATGERHLIVDQSTDTERALCWPSALAILEDRTLIADKGHQAWVRLDLTNNQWDGFPGEFVANASTCARTSIAELKELVADVASSDAMQKVLQSTTFDQPATMLDPGVETQLRTFLRKFADNLIVTFGVVSGLISLPMLFVIFYPVGMSILGATNLTKGGGPVSPLFLALTLFSLPIISFLVLMAAAASMMLGGIAMIPLSPLVLIYSLLVPYPIYPIIPEPPLVF